LALDALLQPLMLFFLLGALAAFARSNLVIPEAVAKRLSRNQMTSIGLRGGKFD